MKNVVEETNDTKRLIKGKSFRYFICIACIIPILVLSLFFIIDFKSPDAGLSTEDKTYYVYSLASISGFDGTFEEWQNSLIHDEIEVSIVGTNVMWKYRRETEWKILYNVLEFGGGNGLDGTDGTDGEDGLSAYEIWESFPQNNGKSPNDFVDSLNPYAIWASKPENLGKTEEEFWDEMIATNGEDGKDSSYVLYLAYKNLGYVGSFDKWKEEYGNKLDGNLELNIYYKVLFMDDQNNKIDEIEVKRGEKIPTSEVPLISKDDYELIGWFYDDNGFLEQWVFSGYNVTQATVLYPQFRPITHEIIYDLDGGLNHSDNKLVLDNVNDSFELNSPSKVGYDFVKWVDSNGVDITTIDSDNKYAKAIWVETNFTITYELVGGVNSEANPSIVTISEFIYLDSATKIGYDFLGWENSDGELITYLSQTTKNVSLTARWELSVYTITYIVDGEIVVDNSNPSEISFNEFYELNDYNRPHYEFLGWYIGSIKVENLENITSNLYLEARLKEKEYQINYILSDGINNLYNPTYVSISKNEIELLTPTKVGYEFLGWLDIDGDIVETVTVDNCNYLKAGWKLEVYTITYIDEHEANNINPINVTYFHERVLQNLAKQGYNFIGWYTENGILVEELKKISCDMTLTAVWELTKFTITYNLGGGSLLTTNPTTITCEDNIILNDPVMKYYDFLNWEYNGNSVDRLVDIYEDIELNALWSPSDYFISYELNGGYIDEEEGINPTIMNITSGKVYLIDAEKVGYEFLGWYNGNIEITSLDKLESNIHLEAKWDIKPFPIAYNLNGGKHTHYNPMTITIEDVITLNAPEKEYYDFDAWVMNGEIFEVLTLSNISTDIEITAMWTATEYTVNYVLNGGTNSSLNLTKIKITDEQFTIKSPSKSGFAFYGWYTEMNFTTRVTSLNVSLVKGDSVTLYAKFIPSIRTDSNGVQYFYYGSYPQSLLTSSSLINLFRNYNRVGTFSYLGVKYTEVNNNFYIHEPVRWNVISTENQGSYTAVSDIMIDASQYHTSTYNQIYFYNTALYKYLNNYLIYDLFTTEEMTQLQTVFHTGKLSIPTSSQVEGAANQKVFSNLEASDYAESIGFTKFSQYGVVYNSFLINSASRYFPNSYYNYTVNLSSSYYTSVLPIKVTINVDL